MAETKATDLQPLVRCPAEKRTKVSRGIYKRDFSAAQTDFKGLGSFQRTWEQEVQEKTHKLHIENLQMQKELEEARMQHEVKLLNLQQENDWVRK